VLINYNGKFTDVSTLAHELGTRCRVNNSTRRSPIRSPTTPPSSRIASTFNESLLIDYMLKQIKDEATRSSSSKLPRGHQGDGLPPDTVRRVELKIHEMGQKGSRSPARRCPRYGHHEEYYGHDQGVCIVDPYIVNEWSHLHFYRDFYVFQHATSFTASEAVPEKVKAGTRTKKRYLTFLSAGGSATRSSPQGRRRT
jgi:oligoendopeptidase F